MPDYTFKGKYATYVKHLTEIQKGEEKIRIFPRIIDVYMMGAIVGFLNSRQESYDSSKESKNEDDEMSTSTSTIKENTFLKEQRRIDLLYQLIIINENTREFPPKKRINNAFRGDSSDEVTNVQNMEIINSYVLGGISYLYNRFQDARTKEEVAMVMNDMLEEFIQDREIKLDQPTNRSD
jgi:hypothetical protein